MPQCSAEELRTTAVSPEDFAKWIWKDSHTLLTLSRTDLWRLRKGRCSRENTESSGRSPLQPAPVSSVNKSQGSGPGLRTETMSSTGGLFAQDAPSRGLSRTLSRMCAVQWADENVKEH